MATRRIDLNGTWDFVADLDPKYHAIHGGFHLPGANRRHWAKVPVPGVWQKYAERYDIFEGVYWFSREFAAPEVADRAVARLRFGAVNYLANVYLNGEKVGSHEGGYTEFVLDVSGKLRPGLNHLAVQVDNRALITRWPPCLGYFNYGGIHRDVSLEIATGPALADVRLEAVPTADGWELSVSGRIDSLASPEPVAPLDPTSSPLDPTAPPVGATGPPVSVTAAPIGATDQAQGLLLRVRSDGRSGEAAIGAGGALAARVSLPGAPSWTPESPHLVPVTVELLDEGRTVLDRRDFRFGCRTIAMRDGQVQLNGQPYPLKGVCYVYDSETTGLVMTPAQLATDLRLMKEAGCNAVRCHYPMDAAFYEACDRLGLLVWIEPPVYCYHPGDSEAGTRFADPDWLCLAQTTALEMIAVARNHPSVAIYSIGNECNTANPEAEAFFRQLAATLRAADPTRLISYAALYGIVGPIAEIVDVLGINSYWGWYDRIWVGKGPPGEVAQEGSNGGCQVEKEPIDLAPMRQMLDKVLARKQRLALLLTEFGADSVPGFLSASRDLWSENYHADLLRGILALAMEYPQIVGTFPFCLTDYRDPSKVPNGYWNELNLKGLVDYRRNRKLAFAALAAAYGASALESRGVSVPSSGEAGPLVPPDDSRPAAETVEEAT